MTTTEIEQEAYNYTFKKYAVRNDVTDSVQKSFIDGATWARNLSNKETNLLIIKYKDEVFEFNKLLEKKIFEHEDYKQFVFKQKSDSEFKEWEKMQNDIKFLYEMKSRAANAFDNRDVSDKEMLYKMIEDWIDELSKKCDKL